MSMRAFISYSHKDTAAVERLHTHLALLLREGRIDAWFDRMIMPGGQIDVEITRELEECDLFMILVSPDFLASDYCVNREMRRALERHNAGEAHVVPIIIRPCDWMSSPLGQLKALPCDGKPISEWSNDDSAYLDVVNGLRLILDANQVVHRPSPEVSTSRPSRAARPDARRYRVRRDFDQIERTDFRDRSFAIIRDFFQKSITEIDSVDDVRGRFEDVSRNSFRCTVVNRALGHGRGTAHIAVHCRSDSFSLGDIYWSYGESASPGQANGMLNVEADDYELYLSSILGIRFSGERERITAEEAANIVWNEFLQHAGISYA